MFKLCSNGGTFETLLSLRLHRLALYSTSSATVNTASEIVKFMVNTLGFSEEEAVSASKKVSAVKNKLSGKPDVVVEFLKQRGLSIAQIKKLISAMPVVLFYKVDRTLTPKFNALQELGVTGSDLGRILSMNPSILRRGLSSHIAPAMNLLKSIVGTHEHFLTVLRRTYWFMSCDVDTILKPNLELLRSHGFSDERIRKLVVFNPEILGHDPKKLRNILHRIENEFGIPGDSFAFVDAIVLLASLSDKTLQTKYQILKSYGWTDSDIITTVRKLPRCLLLSEKAIRNRLDFFLNELGCEPAYVASRPYVLVYSMEDRVMPRNAVLQVLKEKKLVNQISILTAVCISEHQFLEQYVVPYKDVFPELYEAYISRKQGCSSVKPTC